MPEMASAQVDAPVALAPTSETPPTETLREHSRKLIEDTLAAHGGNVSQAARQLRVSRGTLYRRLRGWRDDDSSAAVD
ncbi:Bacterial regulatory protein, Fis family [compost metagenome]